VDSEVYEVQAEYFKALSHPIRIKIVQYLREGEESKRQLVICDV